MEAQKQAKANCVENYVEVKPCSAIKEARAMPEIARFYGIKIQIHFNREHNPPHFHALYSGREGAFDILTSEMLYGDLPAKAQSLVKEWAAMHQKELMAMWETKILQKLQPLE